MRIISWNVNGLRAAVKKDFIKSMKATQADVICLQETKAQPEEVEMALENLDGFHIYANSATRKGYASTAILSREKPLDIIHDMKVPEHDDEGRIITVEMEHFFLVTAYVPNSGRGLVRLEYRKRWDADFIGFLKNLEKKKPVILCGDLNVAHQAIDLANPKSNYNKTAGYTQDEIDGFSHLLKNGFIDVFRHRNPDTVKYSWWSYMFNARKKNVGWRIDYFVVSESLLPKIKDCQILNDIMGSDHCPIQLDISD
ncbi:MAG: exodeoxyribonuclease III [Saprospiraceae bacterium]|nr:exodeoxyribonuclease III [Saprospiraceae bacterium]